MVLSVILWFWLFEPGFQALLGSRKEDLVDNGTLDSLFGKLRYMLYRLPFKPEGWSMRSNATYMKLANPVNGNVIKGESANAEFSRQGRYRVIVMDEGGFWENVQSAWTAAGDASPCRCLITTPPVRVNYTKYLRFSGKIDVKVLNWRLHPKKDETWFEEQKHRRTAQEIAQELENDWEGAITGRVYPEVGHVRVGDFPYRPDWPLYPTHDPGHHPDPHAIGWFQVDPESGRYRLIESFEVVNKIAEWFFPLFGLPIDSQFSYTPEELEFISKVSKWKRGQHFGDQYGRTTNQVTGSSVYDAFATVGIYINSNTKANDLESRKTAARKVLMNLDVNDTVNNRYFMECLKNARYPDLGEQSNRVTPNTAPIHDWTSHNRTVLEFFAVNIDWRPNEYVPEGDTFLKALAEIQSNKQNLNDHIDG